MGASSHNRVFTNMLMNFAGGNTGPPADIAGEGVTGDLGFSPIVYAGTIDPTNPGCDILYPAGTFSGEIVVCDYNQGPGAIPDQYNGRVNKSINLAQAGAGGFILINRVDWAAALMVDSYPLPGMVIPYDDGEALKTWLASGSGHQGSIRGVENESARGDIMAGFTSRGPSTEVPDIIKPDVTAPGRRIVAAIATTDPTDPPEFDVYQGTSMSSPHAAGAAALMRAAHSNWTPSEIQSALMGTALNNGVLKEDATTEADPFDMGAGRIDLSQAVNAALVLDVTTDEFEDANPAEGGDPKALNLASLGNSQCILTCSWTRTVRSTLGMTQTWNATVMAAPGVTLTGSVDPATFELTPGATQELTITVDVSELPKGEWFFAELTLMPIPPPPPLHSGAPPPIPVAHMPIAVQSSTGVLPTEIEINTRRNAGSQLVEGIEAIEITDLTVDSLGLTQADLSRFELLEDPTNDIPEGFYDDLSQVFWMTMTVPADSYSLIADIISSESPDLDMAVGFDTDGDGEPEESEQICQSAGGSWTEFCEIISPQAGTWWVVVLNWEESADAPDAVTLATAVVPNSDNGNMTVAGPENVPTGEMFDIRLFWDTPEMVAGDRWYGYVSLGSDGANAGNIGSIPVYLNRHPDDVTKEVSDALVEAGEMVTYTITVHPNVTPEELTYSLTDTIPAGMTYVADSASATDGTVDVTGDTLTWTGTLPTIGIPTLVESNVTGYISLAGLGVTSAPCPTDCDDGGLLITALDITYQGLHYTEAIWSVNGTLELGQASGVTSGALNQELPNPAIPNNLLAPWWTDLNLGAGGNWYIGNLTDEVNNNYTVFEWEDVPLSDDATSTATFQIWFLDGSDLIWFTYDEITGDTSVATVGVENQDGTFGDSYYYDGVGTLPSSANDLVITDLKEPVVITFQATVSEDAVGDVTNTVYHNTDNMGSMEDMASATTEVYDDGIDDETEDGAPNGGDGNGDGIPDSEQGNVASLPNAGDEGGYVTFETPEDISLANISASPAPMTLPTGVEALPQGLFDFTVEGLTPGDSVTVTLYLYGSENKLDSYWKYDEATDTWTDVSSIATFETAVISDTTVATVMLNLTDGGVGDADGEANGTIVDPGGPAYRAPTSISLANFGQEVSLAWQSLALLALLLVLLVGGGIAILQRRRMA